MECFDDILHAFDMMTMTMTMTIICKYDDDDYGYRL